MSRPRLLLAATASAAVLLTSSLAPNAAHAEGDGVFENFNRGFLTTFDILVLRPAGVVRCAIGAGVGLPISSAMNLIALPISRDSTVFADDWDKFVVGPVEYTFKRPVGVDLL